MYKPFLVFLLFLSGFSFAQSGKSNWTFGGHIAINNSFGRNDNMGVHIAPRVGYRISENWETGMSAGVNWQNSSYASLSVFGIGPFVNYYFRKNFYASGLFQEYIINQKIKSSGNRTGFDESALYIGGGYVQAIGRHTSLQIGALYNVLWKENTSVFSSSLTPTVGVFIGL